MRSEKPGNRDSSEPGKKKTAKPPKQKNNNKKQNSKPWRHPSTQTEVDALKAMLNKRKKEGKSEK